MTYTVDLTGDEPTCSCPDYEARRSKCKHVYAVEFSIRRETLPDGSTTVTKTVRVTYKQDWPAYNAAQTHEKARVAELLRGLCDGVVQPAQGRGRPRLPLSDVIFSAAMKVYSTVSGRRATSDLRDCQANGYMARAPHYNSVFNYLENPALTFLASYHKRSNVESTFSMIKAKFGASVRAKTPVAQTNEVLCKVLCHNLCVLVHSIYELGIAPTFWAENTPAQEKRLNP